MTEIIIQAYQVLDEILKDEHYIEMKRLNQSIIKKYENEISAFNEAKDLYSQIMQEGGTYHPDFKRVSNLLSETKRKLYETDDMKRYVLLEKTLQTEINTFLADLTEFISPHMKTPDVFGIIKKGGSCHVR
ncbi:MAG: hypothetical protein RBQ78_02305 [Acholeplasmataceae bacterium]|jgi:cell fate (sporulation/competence/biofilm development) regulator YlbF (YheA/YmcA/DUF963 family)|nr:hypothetical protein [Acholeplasmataceae bacterium]MDY0338587.1 hypothetical protein [Acholeplasmataceae bacterium]